MLRCPQLKGVACLVVSLAEARMDYVVWKAVPESEDACMLKGVKGPRKLELLDGVSLAADFKDAKATMRPRGERLLDSLMNTSHLVVISPRLRQFLEEQKVPGVEYLPVTVVKASGETASTDYVVLNPLVLQDCLD